MGLETACFVTFVILLVLQLANVIAIHWVLVLLPLIILGAIVVAPQIFRRKP
jgi:hypothetical protein